MDTYISPVNDEYVEILVPLDGDRASQNGRVGGTSRTRRVGEGSRIGRIRKLDRMDSEGVNYEKGHTRKYVYVPLPAGKKTLEK